MKESKEKRNREENQFCRLKGLTFNKKAKRSLSPPPSLPTDPFHPSPTPLSLLQEKRKEKSLGSMKWVRIFEWKQLMPDFCFSYLSSLSSTSSSLLFYWPLK